MANQTNSLMITLKKKKYLIDNFSETKFRTLILTTSNTKK